MVRQYMASRLDLKSATKVELETRQGYAQKFKYPWRDYRSINVSLCLKHCLFPTKTIL